MKNHSPIRIFIAFLVSLVCSLFTYAYISKSAYQTVDKIELSYTIDKDSILHFFYDSRGRDAANYTLENSQAQPAYAGAKRTLVYLTKSRSIDQAQLNVGSPSKLTVESLALFNAISGTRKELTIQDIQTAFSSIDESSSIFIENGKVVIETFSFNSPVSFSVKDFQGKNNFLLYFMMLLIGGLSFLLVLRTSFNAIPAISDIHRHSDAQKGYRLELDGLRGIAAILVLLEHTWWRFSGSGATGVWMFFALSGYLLSQPFLSKPGRALQAGYITNYIFRRLARILPMYIVTLVLIFGVTQESQLFLSHLLFLRAEGHLWTIPQEVFFYLVLPIIVVVLFYLQRLPAIAFIIVFFIIVCVFLFNPNILGVKLYNHKPPYLGWFMTGMLVAYAAHSLNRADISSKISLKSNHRNVLSLLGIVLLVLILGASSSWVVSLFTGEELILPAKYKAEFAIASTALMAIIIATPGTLLSRILMFWPLRAIGIVGYSFYLIHPLVIEAVMQASWQYFNVELLHGRLFIVSGVITWVICLFTYSLIEKPFLQSNKYQITR